MIARHYPRAAEAANPAVALLEAVIAAQAALVARWLLVGFVHGVMNTDNMSVAGETIDYGPCAFLDAYDPAAVFSSIDANGRYAYRNQPGIAHWNLTRLAEAMLPLLADDEDVGVSHANAALDTFAGHFEAAYHGGLGRKIGLGGEREGDAALAGELLAIMAANRADFTLTFRRLGDAAADAGADEGVRELFIDPTAYDGWAARWRQRSGEGDGAARRAAMHAVNPAYIPRNHHVEAALEAAMQRADFAPFAALGDALARPYEERPGLERYASSPVPDGRVYRTFCGT